MSRREEIEKERKVLVAILSKLPGSVLASALFAAHFEEGYMATYGMSQEEIDLINNCYEECKQ